VLLKNRLVEDDRNCKRIGRGSIKVRAEGTKTYKKVLTPKGEGPEMRRRRTKVVRLCRREGKKGNESFVGYSPEERGSSKKIRFGNQGMAILLGGKMYKYRKKKIRKHS